MKEAIEFIDNRIVDLTSEKKTYESAGLYSSASFTRDHINDLLKIREFLS